ncbi:MAG: L,D-transpeptidase, partial [Gammaproteobacteria bacterium]|nr:L,D-transpeptidase [Gammaproteobacteria bacterium]
MIRSTTYSLCLGLFITLISVPVFAKHYGRGLCTTPGYTCIKTQRGDTWHSLWPDQQKRRIVMRVNRMSTRLWSGMIVAVPDGLMDLSHMDVSPMPYSIKPNKHNTIMISKSKQAFGAYDTNGYLIHWGPISAGKGWCPDVAKRCVTPSGNFSIIRKGDVNCISTIFPVPDGGAPMAFCMFFSGGYALHAGDLPGYNA